MIEQSSNDEAEELTDIELEELRAQWRQEAFDILGLDPKRYGRQNLLTKEGFLALARAGKEVWNEWRRTNANQTPDFSGVDFTNDPIDFSGFDFETSWPLESANFSHAVFGNAVDFSRTKFGNDATFQHAKFRGDADFIKSKFGSNPDFTGAHFMGSVLFWRAEVGFRPCFDGAVFEGSAVFTSSSIGDRASFKNCSFKSGAGFAASNSQKISDEMKSFNSISFAGTEFFGDVTFNGRKFLSTTDFGPSLTIEKNTSHRPLRFIGIPDFHGCKFHQDTSFDGAEFHALPSPEAARAYRTLKLAMEQLKATREEQKFFRLEMKAEHPSLPRGKRWISTLYSLFSQYGFSLWRPVIALLIFSLFFGAAYGLLANSCASDSECNQAAIAANATSGDERTSDLLKYTLASVAPVPGLDKMQTELRAPLFGQHGWIAVTAIVLEIFHKIVALVMTFLFALALRNLFKMKS